MRDQGWKGEVLLPFAAEVGMGSMEQSCVSLVVTEGLRLVWCPGADLLSPLCSALLPYTFTIHRVAVPFPRSCDKNLHITGTGTRPGMCTTAA